MELTFTQKKSIRKNFGKLTESLAIPNLIEVQKNSYEEFLKSKTHRISCFAASASSFDSYHLQTWFLDGVVLQSV